MIRGCLAEEVSRFPQPFALSQPGMVMTTNAICQPGKLGGIQEQSTNPESGQAAIGCFRSDDGGTESLALRSCSSGVVPWFQGNACRPLRTAKHLLRQTRVRETRLALASRHRELFSHFFFYATLRH